MLCNFWQYNYHKNLSATLIVSRLDRWFLDKGKDASGICCICKPDLDLIVFWHYRIYWTLDNCATSNMCWRKSNTPIICLLFVDPYLKWVGKSSVQHRLILMWSIWCIFEPDLDLIYFPVTLESWTNVALQLLIFWLFSRGYGLIPDFIV